MATPEKKKNAILIYISVIFLIGISYPILALFNKQITILGFPLLYLYLFACWVILVFFLFYWAKNKAV